MAIGDGIFRFRDMKVVQRKGDTMFLSRRLEEN